MKSWPEITSEQFDRPLIEWKCKYKAWNAGSNMKLNDFKVKFEFCIPILPVVIKLGKLVVSSYHESVS